MPDELLRVLTRDPLVLLVQVYMLGFVICAAVVLLVEPMRRWAWPVLRRPNSMSSAADNPSVRTAPARP